MKGEAVARKQGRKYDVLSRFAGFEMNGKGAQLRATEGIQSLRYGDRNGGGFA